MPHFPKVMWLTLCRSSESSCGRGNLRSPKSPYLPWRLTRSVSRVCDQHFARFEQAGWQGSRRLSEEVLHHSLGAALFTWGAGANKLYGFFDSFPAEMEGCGVFFHCVHWSFFTKININFVMNEAWPQVQISYHLVLKYLALNDD